MSQKTTNLAKMTREMDISSIRAVEGEGNERKFRLSFSSEVPYERYDGPEILDHKEGAVDLTRLNTIGTVLFNHNRDFVVGRINKAWLENGRGEAEIEFDSDEESQVIADKVKSGSLRGVSVGYAITALERVKKGKCSRDGRFQGPCNVATRWMPYEISVVSVPADASVGVGRSMEEGCENTDCRSQDVFERQLQINNNLLQ